MTPRRIGYVINVFPKLSETFIMNELAELQRRGVAVRILSLRRPADGARHETVSELGLDQLTCWAPAEFASVVRDFQPQLLHAHFATEPTETARALAGQFKLPFTFTAHGYDIRRKPPADFAARAAAARAVVTVSHANARHIVATFGVPAEHLHVIPCGVDVTRFRPLNGALPVADPPLIVCVARLEKVKNLGLLLAACAELRQRGTSFRCVIVGDGRQRAELEATHRQLALSDAVQFAGAATQQQVVGWWQRASVAVLTSENEGMPVCLMEAAACGVPAVATAVGGVPEVIEDGTTGLLTPAGDAPALATALQRALTDQPWAARAGRAARRRAEARFALREQVDRLLALWAEVL